MVACLYNEAMAKKRPAKRNPVSSRDTTNYWLALGLFVTLGVAAFGIKYMSDADRKKAIGI